MPLFAKSKLDWPAFKEEILSSVKDWSFVYGVLNQQKEKNNGWIEGCCPLPGHDDSNPSFGYHEETGDYRCFSCGGSGSAFDFLQITTGCQFKDALLEVGRHVGLNGPSGGGKGPRSAERPPIPEESVAEWCANLWKPENEAVVQWIREKRGLNDKTIKRFQVGWNPRNERNTIPVRDELGKLGNIRLYNAKKKPKILNYTSGKQGYGSPARLYGADDLIARDPKEVLICEGEWDRILLEQEGFPAVCSTHGATTFLPEWGQYFQGKNVVIIFDCDEEGINSAKTRLLPILRNSDCASIRNVRLPLKGTKDDKDVTDWLQVRGHTAEELRALINGTPDESTAPPSPDDEEIIDLPSLKDISKKEFIDKKVRLELTVYGETSEEFHAVEEFRIEHCAKGQLGKCYNCKGFSAAEEIPRNSAEYIGSCMSSDAQVKQMLREYACKLDSRPRIEITRRVTVKEFFAHQRIHRVSDMEKTKSGETIFTVDGKQEELVEKKVYYLSHETPKPGNYLATGWVKTHPKTQQVALLIETLIRQDDDWESFKTEENIEHLRAWKALSLEEKLTDISSNITMISGRDEILLAALLTYLSPRWIPFNGQRVRGWLVSLIIGDAGSGKTQTYSRIAEFIDVGDCISGLTASRTGLVYAMVEHKQKGWTVRVGRYPANTRKLLAIDEVQFIEEEHLRTMAKGMEEGFIQVDRVSSKGYESQTRLFMMANPKNDRTMDTFSFGCQAISSVFPSTIIRRTDLVVFANSSDIKDLSFINAPREKGHIGLITPSMLRSAVYWAWNLTPDRIKWEAGAEEEVLAQSKALSDKYGDASDIPLVTRSDFRNNLARITVAIACLALSCDDNFINLQVTLDHAKMAAEIIDMFYGADNCALNQYSDYQKTQTQLVDYDDIAEYFFKRQEEEKKSKSLFSSGEGFFTTLTWIMRMNETIRKDDILEQVGCSPETLRKHMQILKRFGLVVTTKYGYAKRPKFVKFLRRFTQENKSYYAQVSGNLGGYEG